MCVCVRFSTGRFHMCYMCVSFSTVSTVSSVYVYVCASVQADCTYATCVCVPFEVL